MGKPPIAFCRWIVTTAIAVSFFLPPAFARAIHWKVAFQPQRIVNGSPIVFRVHASSTLKQLSGTWLNHDIYFSWDPSSREWTGIAGVGLDTAPGSYPLNLVGELADSSKATFDQSLAVHHTKYPNVAITVDHKFTEPNPAEVEEIQKDKAIKQEAFSRPVSDRQWSGGFQAPVTARISDVFGTTRTFNGKVQSTHEGLDYAVPGGTTIEALNHGTVILARPLFFEGNFVVIDHGQGLLTLYLHLSEIGVKEGEEVSRGQKIGLSGGTGRATGPHLHIAVRWQGTYLDPATLFKLNLPAF